MSKSFNLTETDPDERTARRNLAWQSIFSVAIAFLTFFLVIRLYPLTMLLLHPAVSISYRTIPVDWNHLGNVTSVATFAVVLGGTLFAYREYVQNEKKRIREDAESAFNFYKQMYDWLTTPQAEEARRWVIVNLPTMEQMNNDADAWFAHVEKMINNIPRGYEGNRPPGRDYLKEILNTLDIIGFVTKNYWSVTKELAAWMCPVVAKVWERIGPYIEREAELRNEPDYYIAAREYGTYCVEWQRMHDRLSSRIIQNAT